MSKVARELRRSTLAAARAQTPEERLLLALRLGDSDVALFRGARPAEEARRALERQRGAGRRPSACAAGR